MSTFRFTHATLPNPSMQGSYKPAAEDAAKAKALINFLMQDRFFLALYRSDDPKVRAVAMDKLNKAHHQAYGDAPTQHDDAARGRTVAPDLCRPDCHTWRGAMSDRSRQKPLTPDPDIAVFSHGGRPISTYYSMTRTFMAETIFEIPQTLRDVSEQNLKLAHAAYDRLIDFVMRAMDSWMEALPSISCLIRIIRTSKRVIPDMIRGQGLW